MEIPELTLLRRVLKEFGLDPELAAAANTSCWPNCFTKYRPFGRNRDTNHLIYSSVFKRLSQSVRSAANSSRRRSSPRRVPNFMTR